MKYNESNKHDYIDDVLIPSITKHDKRFEVEDMSGGVSFYGSKKGYRVNGKVYPYCFTTPLWETDENVIPIDVCNEEGEYEHSTNLPFELSFDVVRDTVLFVTLVDGWLKKHGV